MAAAAATPTAALPPLKTVTNKVSQKPEYLFMCTNNTSMTKNESLFKSADGALVFKLENNNGFFSKKVLYDGHGNVLLTCKKSLLSLAKWSISLPNGTVVAKTSTISGMVKYAIEVKFPGRSGKFVVSPDASLQKVLMWQSNGKQNGKEVEDTPLCEAAYASSVVMGMISAAVQDWSYHVALEPGADTALVCCLLVIYTDLLEWNALGGAFGMV